MTTFARTKWKSISMCFVRARKIGFTAIYVVLAHYHTRQVLACRQTHQDHQANRTQPQHELLIYIQMQQFVRETIGCILAFQRNKIRTPRKSHSQKPLSVQRVQSAYDETLKSME